MKRMANNGLRIILPVLLLLAGCSVNKHLPQPKKGIELLSGGWKIEASSDNNALLGSMITVYAESGDGLVSFLQNNSYCIRPNEVIWKDITTINNESFNINSLVNSCKSSLVYKPATLTLTNSDELKLSGTTAAGKELVQNWKRVPKQ